MKSILQLSFALIISICLSGCETMTKADLDRMTPAQREAYYQQKTSEEVQNRILAAYVGGQLTAMSQQRPQPVYAYPVHSTCVQQGVFVNCNYY